MHVHTKVRPGLATHDVFAERRLRAWRRDIRYMFLLSLIVYTLVYIQALSPLCLVSHFLARTHNLNRDGAA